MMNYRYKPQLILVHPEAEAQPVTQKVLARFPDIAKQYAPSIEEWLQKLRSGRYPITQGKRVLYLTLRQGQFLKPCPGICDHVACCQYHIVDLGSNCPLECTYCVLQSYLNNPLMVLYVNIEGLLAELDAALTQHPDKIFRIGTGELTDSLALDWLSGFTHYLVPFFATHRNAFLELKTKTIEIDNLEHLRHEGQTIVSWSLNSPKIIATEEYKTCSLDDRLKAARRCADWGYRLGFHFDPLVHYPGWEKDYRVTVNRLFEAIPARQIAWISLGALRLPPGLRAVMMQRFPKSPLPLGEFVLGIDGKGRYFRPLRTGMYRKMAEWIHGHNPQQAVYLCMESPQVWRQSMGWEPSSSEVASMLDRSLGVGIRD